MKFWRIHFYTVSTYFYSVSLHFYTVCLQQILVECWIRNSWRGGRGDGEEGGGCSHFKKSPLYQILDTKSLLMKDAIQNHKPKAHHTVKRCRDPALGTLLGPVQLLPLHCQQTELSPFTVARAVVGRGHLCLSYRKTSHQQTGKKFLVLFITDYPFTEI